jgi:hypothetical protein
MASGASAFPRTPICASCGVVAPVHATACASCEKPLAQPRAFAPPHADVFWAALRCTFPCRACGFPSPLDGVVDREQLDCAQCGSLQRFDMHGWTDALAFARAVGDLGGPHPEGRYPSPDVWIGDANPYADVGSTRTFAVREDPRLRVEASPGFPVCRRCARPLDCVVGGEGVETRCGGCGAVGRYRAPATLNGFAPDARGVASEEHRLDRRDVRVQPTEAGVAALICPQCGAGLHAIGGPIVECTYCRTMLFIPPRARPRESGRLVAPTVFWVAFAGPSPERIALETPAPPAEAASPLKAVGFVRRGLSPLPGIELADKALGVDVKHLAVVLTLTVLALCVGYLAMLGAGC